MHLPRVLLVVSLLLAWFPHLASAGETCYMTVFSAQRTGLNRPCFAHTFAVFVRVTNEGTPAACLETFAISWLPQKGAVHLGHLLPETGRNFDLSSTLRLSLAEGSRLSMWGPYRIEPELFQRACLQRQRLESGAVCYKAVDTGYVSSEVSNCIHAVSDLDGDVPRVRLASPGWGDTASYFVTLRLLPWIVDPRKTSDWVATALGLDAYPIVRRNLAEGDPNAGPLVHTIEQHRFLRLEERQDQLGMPGVPEMK